MRTDTLCLAVRPDRAIASVRNNVRHALSLHAKVVVGNRTQPPAPQMRHEFAPGYPSLLLRVFPYVTQLEEIFLVPWGGAAHHQCWRVNRMCLSEHLRHIFIKRYIWRGVFESRLAIHEHRQFVIEIA